MKRRLLASILTLVMVPSLLPTAVLAADGEEDVTPEDTSENEIALLSASQLIEGTTN